MNIAQNVTELIGRTPLVIPAPAKDATLRVELVQDNYKPWAADVIVVDGKDDIVSVGKQTYEGAANSVTPSEKTGHFRVEVKLAKIEPEGEKDPAGDEGG